MAIELISGSSIPAQVPAQNQIQKNDAEKISEDSEKTQEAIKSGEGQKQQQIERHQSHKTSKDTEKKQQESTDHHKMLDKKLNGEPLDIEEQTEVTELKSRDQKVKTHEQAHVAAGGTIVTGGPFYEYQTGPDGNKYAVGGHVNIDTSPVKDNPEATIIKAQTIKKAALAPANPSGSDRAVATKANQMESKAQKKLQQNENEEITQKDKTERKNAPYAMEKTEKNLQHIGSILDITT